LAAANDAAAIVEGTVTDISFSYDDVQGPRTITTLTTLTPYRGSVGTSLQIVTMGGPLPDGRYLHIPELPELRSGCRYLLFLTSRDWFYSPIVADYAFRIEQVGGKEVLLNQTGNPITFISPTAIAAAPLSLDSPNRESSHHLDRPILVADAAARSAQALSRSEFFNGLADVLKQASPALPFKPTARGGRSWLHTPVSAGLSTQ
jgi:hypothetical protein